MIICPIGDRNLTQVPLPVAFPVTKALYHKPRNNFLIPLEKPSPVSSGFISPGHRSLESGNGSTGWALTASAAETQEGGRHSGSRTAHLIAQSRVWGGPRDARGGPRAAGFKASFLCPCGIPQLSFEMTGTRIPASDEEEGAWEESAWEQQPSWDLYPPCS